jgi:hypothetical protein
MNSREPDHIPSGIEIHFTKASFATAFAYASRVCLSTAVSNSNPIPPNSITRVLPFLSQPVATVTNAWPVISQGKGFGLNYLRGTSSIFLLTATNDWMQYYVGNDTVAAKSVCFAVSTIPGTAMALAFESRFIRKTSPQFDVPGKVFKPNYTSMRLASFFLARETAFMAVILTANPAMLIGSSFVTAGLHKVIVLEANKDKHNIPLMPTRGQSISQTLKGISPPNVVFWRFAYMGSVALANIIATKIGSLGFFKQADTGDVQPVLAESVNGPSPK